MASTSEATQPLTKQKSVKDALTGTDLQDSLKIGTRMFYVALAPLIMQVCLFIYFFLYPPASGTTSTFQSTARAVPNLQPDVGEKGSGLNCVIGFADLHGDVVKAREVLEASGASNTTHLWAAGECTLVQTGDLVDRGPDSVGVTKLFEDVKTAAADAGGHVVTLLGNHELMNLQGDFRYISKDELTALGESGLKSNTLEELLAAVPAKYRDSVGAYAGSQYLAGAAVWGQLMGPEGWFGQSIRAKPAATVQGSGLCRTLFVHAGLLPNMLEVVSGEKFSSLGDTLLDRLNTALLAALSACDGQHACPAHGTASGIAAGLGENGPFWTRHYALDKESQICSKVEKVLEEVGANRMVVGHTVQENVNSRCDGKVLLMDVGMTRWIRGKNIAAFKCVDGNIDLIDT